MYERDDDFEGGEATRFIYLLIKNYLFSTTQLNDNNVLCKIEILIH